jgi:hypothetical protein
VYGNNKILESSALFLLSNGFKEDVDLLSYDRQYLKKDSVELIETTPSSR